MLDQTIFWYAVVGVVIALAVMYRYIYKNRDDLFKEYSAYKKEVDAYKERVRDDYNMLQASLTNQVSDLERRVAKAEGKVEGYSEVFSAMHNDIKELSSSINDLKVAIASINAVQNNLKDK